MNLNLDPDEYVERLHRNIKSAWNQGEEAERERIIKLLEPLAQHDEWCYDEGKVNCYSEDCQASSYQYAIELIKGEQK
jgi:hypothetical protein